MRLLNDPAMTRTTAQIPCRAIDKIGVFVLEWVLAKTDGSKRSAAMAKGRRELVINRPFEAPITEMIMSAESKDAAFGPITASSATAATRSAAATCGAESTE